MMRPPGLLIGTPGAFAKRLHRANRSGNAAGSWSFCLSPALYASALRPEALSGSLSQRLRCRSDLDSFQPARLPGTPVADSDIKALGGRCDERDLKSRHSRHLGAVRGKTNLLFQCF